MVTYQKATLPDSEPVTLRDWKAIFHHRDLGLLHWSEPRSCLYRTSAFGIPRSLNVASIESRMIDQNSHEAHATAKREISSSRVRSRLAWLVISTIVGLFLGASTLTWVFGTYPSDPFGTTRASGLSGMIGLVLGIIGHVATRPTSN